MEITQSGCIVFKPSFSKHKKSEKVKYVFLPIFDLQAKHTDGRPSYMKKFLIQSELWEMFSDNAAFGEFAVFINKSQDSK